jgi:hypothetical protein
MTNKTFEEVVMRYIEQHHSTGGALIDKSLQGIWKTRDDAQPDQLHLENPAPVKCCMKCIHYIREKVTIQLVGFGPWNLWLCAMLSLPCEDVVKTSSTKCDTWASDM